MDFKKRLLQIAVILPYVISALFMYVVIVPVDSFKEILQGVLVIMGSVILLILVYVLYRHIIQRLDKEHQAKKYDLLFSLVIGFSIANLIALAFQDVFNAPISSVIMTLIIIGVIAPTVLYYYFSHSIKLTTIIFGLNVIIGLLMIGPLIVLVF